MKILTFYSDKGGVGATMFNVSMGAYLLLKHNKRVCIVDTVSGQRSLTEDRIYEVKSILSDKTLQTNYSQKELIEMEMNPLLGPGLHIYKIDRFDDFLLFIAKHKNKYDYLILDNKGMTENNLKILMKSSFIFLITTFEEFKRDLSTYRSFKKVQKMKLFMVEKVFMFFNKIRKDEDIYERIANITKESDVDFLETIFFNRPAATENFSTLTGLLTNIQSSVLYDLDVLFENVFEEIEAQLQTT